MLCIQRIYRVYIEEQLAVLHLVRSEKTEGKTEAEKMEIHLETGDDTHA